VDDNVDSAESLKMLLEMDGHHVEVAHEGDSALRKAEAFKPQAALLDIGLPGMDGYELARKLRSVDGGHTWLIAVSGYGQDLHRRSAEEAGFDRYLVKPVDYDALKELLNSLPPRPD
jgi:two-component system, sensor histidine kinase